MTKRAVHFKSLWAKYVAEREGVQVLEYSRGFVSYKCESDHVYLHDLYVHPDYRNQNVGIKLLQYVERQAATAKVPLYVSVSTESPNWKTMFTLALKFGYKLSHIKDRDYYYIKEF